MASTFLLQAQVPENGLLFDGVTDDDYVSVPTTTGDELNPEFNLTVECWVKLDSAASATHRPHLITRRNSYGLIVETDGYARFFVFTDLWSSTASSTPINPNQWYHLAATFNRDVGRLYVNGVLEGTTAVIDDTLNQNFENVRIGALDITQGIDNTNGMIEEVRIWNVTRTEAEIQASMNQTIPGSTSGLVGYWRLDESTGTTAVDQTSYNNDGTLTNMVPSAWQTSTASIGESSIFAESADISETSVCAVDVEFLSGDGPGSGHSMAVMQVNQLPNSLTGLYPDRASQYWEIWSEDPDFDGNFTADVRFHYDVISGLPTESSMELYRRDDATGTWAAATGYTVVTNDGGSSTGTDGIGYVELTITEATPGDFSGQYILSWTNEPPVVSDIPDQSVAEGTAFATITLDNYVADPDNADSEITWTVTGETDVTVVITDRVATITADDPNWNGTDMVTFTAEDPEGESDSDQVTFEVTPVNDAPVVGDIPDQEIAEGGSFVTIMLDDFVTDIDNDITTMTWTGTGQSDLTVDITDRVATITVNDANWNGNETVTFQAADPDGGTDSDQATFTVTPVNDAPVVDNIPNQTIDEGDSFIQIILDNYVLDVDDADNEITWTVTAESDVTVTITNRVASITANDPEWNGTDVVTFTATDPEGLQDWDNVVFSVTAVNDLPVVADIPDQTIAEGQSFSQLNLDAFVTDADHADESLSWTALGQSDITVTIVDRVATLTVDPDWNGSETIVFLVEDPLGGQDSDTAVLTVTPVNDSPDVSDIPDMEVAESDVFQKTIDLDDFVADVDNTDSEMAWTVQGDTNVDVKILSRVVYITPGDDPEWNGSDTLIFTASDPDGASDTDTIIFTVTGVNDAPTLNKAIPDTSAEVGKAFSFVLDANTFADVDPGDVLVLSASMSMGGSTPAWITFDPVSGTFSGTPADGDKGIVEVIVNATDDSLASVADTFNIDVSSSVGIVNPLSGLEINLYPNPNNGRFVIESDIFELKNVVLEIFNEKGQLIWNREIRNEIGTLHESVDLDNAAEGLYLLRVRNNSGVINKRFVISY